MSAAVYGQRAAGLNNWGPLTPPPDNYIWILNSQLVPTLDKSTLTADPAKLITVLLLNSSADISWETQVPMTKAICFT